MKIWLFATYAWQGNPKALFLYMLKHFSKTHECWWVADNEESMRSIKKATGIENITFTDSKKAKELFQKADVYVTENFREAYPSYMNENIKIFNTWHGVGLKHIELALGMKSVLADSIVRKYIRNYDLYKNNVLFLTTSQAMEDHFIEDMVISPELVIRGKYPRNAVYGKKGIQTYNLDLLLPKKKAEYRQTILFCPTYRIGAVQGVLNSLLPDFDKLEKICRQKNQLFIVKVHPFMKQDDYFIEMSEKYKKSKHILFWNDDYDIYEIFTDIDLAIVDYSSIFYDLLDAGVEKFLRYVPDLEEYQRDLELIGDYEDLTEGLIVKNFQQLVNCLAKSKIKPITSKRKKYLMDYFFGFEKENSTMDSLIQAVDNCQLNAKELKELHTFDIFDTLIRRSTLKPLSIFDYVRNKAKASHLSFPTFVIEQWVELRNKAELDVRDMMRKTTFERQSDKIEVTLDDIYRRIQKHLLLTDEQIEFLKQTEIDAEIAHVEPIQKRIDYLFSLKRKGYDVAMVSDMYLPEDVIRQMLDRADIRLREIPLYLSSTIGHQKSTGKLYQHIFFEIGYQYRRWVHYGDNKHADGTVPRRFGIQTAVHDIDDFIPFEASLINAMDNYNRYPAYQLATKMHRYRSQLVQDLGVGSSVFETKYYNYAYVGCAFVPYIHWVIKDALRRGYETLYFISRDGHLLKQIADKIIEIKNYNVKIKYIYGSRKAWRLPSFITKVDDETFWQFGNFVGMDSFDDLVKASYLTEKELLDLFPEFESLRNAKHLRGSVAENIRKIFKNSTAYHQKVLALAEEKRKIVRQYLQQEIDPKEKFAFVEFWGRGYTQDAFGRLLNDAFDTTIENPFYYVRSFTEDAGTSVRHNFVLTPQNFAFFEPIFAQTPYDSIAGYEEKAGRIEPIIHYRNSEVCDLISEGLLQFTEDYLSLDVRDSDYFDFALAKFNYQYQLTTPNDQFLCNVFSELKYNESSFGEIKPYAPALTLKQLENIASKQELDMLTASVQMSLAKSESKVIDYYKKVHKNYNLPAFNGNPLRKVYGVNPLEQYVWNKTVPFKVLSLKQNSFYFDVVFTETTKRQDIVLKELAEIEVVAIDWLKGGVPRLLTKYGYITAHKEYVQYISNETAEPVYFAENHSNKGNKDKNGNNNKLPKEKKKSKTDASISVKNTQEKKGLLTERKKRKLARDPYLFFKDAKKPAISALKVFFDEKHFFGRFATRCVRKYYNPQKTND